MADETRLSERIGKFMQPGELTELRALEGRVEKLVRVSNVNGDWNLKYATAIKERDEARAALKQCAEALLSIASRRRPEMDEDTRIMHLESGNFGDTFSGGIDYGEISEGNACADIADAVLSLPEVKRAMGTP